MLLGMACSVQVFPFSLNRRQGILIRETSKWKCQLSYIILSVVVVHSLYLNFRCLQIVTMGVTVARHHLFFHVYYMLGTLMVCSWHYMCCIRLPDVTMAIFNELFDCGASTSTGEMWQSNFHPDAGSSGRLINPLLLKWSKTTRQDRQCQFWRDGHARSCYRFFLHTWLLLESYSSSSCSATTGGWRICCTMACLRNTKLRSGSGSYSWKKCFGSLGSVLWEFSCSSCMWCSLRKW